MNTLLKLIKAKWEFIKPSKKKILIYDAVSEDFLKFLFKKNDYEILDIRYERINLYVIILTLLTYGITNLASNYKKLFIKLVSPRIVVSAIDNDISFYKLKGIFNKPKYVCFQNGIRTNEFYMQCKNYIKNTGYKLYADHIFLLGSNEKKRISKIIKSKFYCLGNIKNNHYSTRKTNIKKKINSIMYISQFNLSMYQRSFYKSLIEDKKIFFFLQRFCREKKIKLIYGAKVDIDMESYIRDILPKGDWIFYPRTEVEKTYLNLNKQQLVVFSWSTLGFEALSKGIKCVSFHKYFPNKGCNIVYPKNGFFWSPLGDYTRFKKLISKVMTTTNKRWSKIARNYSSQILDYDPNNYSIKKTLRKIITS